MSIRKIYDFKLRCGYPNFILSKLQCDEYFNPEKSHPELKGYLPPELDYWLSPDEDPVTLELSSTDIPFLTSHDKGEAVGYLEMLIASRNSDKDAIKFITKIKETYFTDLWERLKKVQPVDNNFVIPSCTRKKYTRGLVSFKGEKLLALTREGYPVPDFSILTSKSYRLPDEKKKKHIDAALENLELLTGQKFGADENPLVFAMRCALPAYIPGLMPTYLNVGITEKNLEWFKNRFGENVANIISHNHLRTIYSCLCPENGQKTEPDDGEDENEFISQMIDYYSSRIREKAPELLTNARLQYDYFIEQAQDFYKENHDLICTFQKGVQIYPSLLLQKMVWTVRDKDSYPGVLYSRHSRTGLGIQVESMKSIFGEDIMTGWRKPEDREFFERKPVKNVLPAIYHFHPLLPQLEQRLKSPATVEFAAESFDQRHYFAVLQLDSSELTGRATLLSTINLYESKVIDKKRVVSLIQPYHLKQIFSERIDDESLRNLQLFSLGNSILPRSAVSAQLYFTAARIQEAKNRGEKVCFCKSTFSPTDRMLLGEIDALLSLTPAAIHVVTACLGYGIPALINLEYFGIRMEGNSLINSQGQVINEGDWITISSKHKTLFTGKANFKPARFLKFLEGQTLEMDTKEEKVFINMQNAFKKYRNILETLPTLSINNLFDLSKLVRNDFQNNPEKAKKLVNDWFDAHLDIYTNQILKSELGSHADQQRIFELLSIDRQIKFFKNALLQCEKKKLKGYNAGSFMLGRFISQMHSIRFWKGFNAKDIVFMLNEFVLFQKYMALLYNFGEKHILKAKNEILSKGLGDYNITNHDAHTFVTLKLNVKNWKTIFDAFNNNFDPETHLLLEKLQLPFGKLYDYTSPWSLSQLKTICEKEKIHFPSADDM